MLQCDTVGPLGRDGQLWHPLSTEKEPGVSLLLLAAKLCPTVFPWHFPGKHTGQFAISFSGIFLNQGSNPHLLQWQVDSEY